MVMSIVSMFTDLFGSCALWLGQVMEASGVMQIWLGCVLIWTVYRFLLRPIFGAAGSDRAKRKSRPVEEVVEG